MGTKVEIAFPFIEATGLNPQFEISSKDKEMFVSANLYTGEEKEINLKALESLVVVSVISIDNYLQEETQIEKDDEVFCNLRRKTILLRPASRKGVGRFGFLRDMLRGVCSFSVIFVRRT